MTKKFKKMRVLLAAMLALTISLSFVPMAYADDDPVRYTEAAVAKVFQMPVGTTTPATEFTFTVTGVSVNNNTAVAPPVIAASPFTLSFTSTDVGTTIGDVKTIIKETPDIFGAVTWPSAGIYEYTVVEDDISYGTTGDDQILTCSSASYTLKVYVRDVDDDDNPVAPYVYHIGALRTSPDGPDNPTGKVDPRPGGDQENYFHSQMTFTNTYYKHDGDTPPNPNRSTLSLMKTVSGDYASSSTPFDFAVTVTKPSLVPGSVSYTAYIIDVDGTFDLTDPISFPSGVAVNVQLKANQKLAFVNTHVGASFEITETGVFSYEPTATVNIPAGGGSVTGDVGEDLTIPSGLIMASVLYVGEGVNTNNVVFDNFFDENPFTGITVENLPFIALIALAVIGLGIFIVVKNRKRKAEDN